jgi:hypothetical protein
MKTRLIEVSVVVLVAGYHNAQDAYAMQDSIIRVILKTVVIASSPYFHKGYGSSHQWVEIYLVYSESGLTV